MNATRDWNDTMTPEEIRFLRRVGLTLIALQAAKFLVLRGIAWSAQREYEAHSAWIESQIDFGRKNNPPF